MFIITFTKKEVNETSACCCLLLQNKREKSLYQTKTFNIGTLNLFRIKPYPRNESRIVASTYIGIRNIE